MANAVFLRRRQLRHPSASLAQDKQRVVAETEFAARLERNLPLAHSITRPGISFRIGDLYGAAKARSSLLARHSLQFGEEELIALGIGFVVARVALGVNARLALSASTSNPESSASVKRPLLRA